MRYIFLLILICAGIGVYFVLVQPKFEHISELRTELVLYKEQLQTAQKLQAAREQLIAVYNSISKSDLDNLKTLLPDSVDNIRLIIQLDSLAQKNGLSTISDVAFDADEQKDTNVSAVADGSEAEDEPYGTFHISFKTNGSYNNLLSFISDIEANLRLVDITDVEFSVLDNQSAKASTDKFDYKVDIETYWLKQ